MDYRSSDRRNRLAVTSLYANAGLCGSIFLTNQSQRSLLRSVWVKVKVILKDLLRLLLQVV